MRHIYLAYFLIINMICGLGIYLLRSNPASKYSRYVSSKFGIDSKDIQHIFSKQPSLNKLWRPPDYNNTTEKDRLTDQYTWIKNLSDQLSNSIDYKKKTILLFDNGRVPNSTVQKIQCPGYELKLCTITKAVINLDLPSQDVGQYDAVIFMFVHRNTVNLTKLVVPKHVKQIIHTEETSYSSIIDFALNGAISVTYFSASDIFLPYGKWVPYSDMKSTIPRMDKNDYTGKTNFAKGKTGIAVMFTSNCKRNVQNNRLGYVNALKKHVQVDVYGTCGNRSCSYEAERKTQCMPKIIQRYKFYLAFENANCRDYITEKAYHNAFGNNAVPVVLGAHPEDYRRAFPSHSYIHVEDFESPEKLAQYLTLLDENDDLYNAYFSWKGKGEFHQARDYSLCRMCGMLFYSDYINHPVWSVQPSTWKDINTCADKNAWYWDKKIK